MAISTQGIKMTIPSLHLTGETASLEVNIKSFPDLGAAPAAIEVTSLADDVQKFIPGIKGMAAMEFVANYDAAIFGVLAGGEGTERTYQLNIGDKTFTITGKHNVLIVGGGLNVAVDMKIVIVPSAEISVA